MEKKHFIKTEISSLASFDSYGGIALETNLSALRAAGIDNGDLVQVEFAGYSIVVPVVPNHRYLKSGGTGLIHWEEDKYISLGTITGNFSGSHPLPDNASFPVPVIISLYEKEGYIEEYSLRNLKRSKIREDYPGLSDEEFANFRELSTTGMGRGIIYRGSSPVDPQLGRNKYINKALEKYSIKTAVNLDNTKESVLEKEGYYGSYYSGLNVIYSKINTDYSDSKTRSIILSTIKALINLPGPYYIHCVEGQDRTGLFCAVLECLMGADYNEILTDYMITYENYYNVRRGEQRYAAIMLNILGSLENAFGTEALSVVNLQTEAENFLLDIGLTKTEIARLKSILSGV